MPNRRSAFAVVAWAMVSGDSPRSSAMASSTTGSRTGSVGALKIIIPGPGGGTVIDGTEFYDKQFWEPKRYWQWQAAVMDGVKEGRVIVGDLETREKDPPKPADKRGD